jgi:hypothetical protein
MINKTSDKIRYGIAIGYACLAAIPCAVIMVAVVILGIVAIALFTPAVLIAPKQDIIIGGGESVAERLRRRRDET